MIDTWPGPQTALALANWGDSPTPRPVIRAYAQVKKAALAAVWDSDRRAGRSRWDESTYRLIDRLLGEVRDGVHDQLFRLPLAQGGAGTSLNMNLNEALCWLAGQQGRDLHPVDDLNRYQSTNDTFPTAATILAYEGLVRVEAAVIRLQEELVRQEKRWTQQPMVGRTELQDALPVTLGQVFASWAGPFERDRWRLGKLKERVRSIPLGSTAVGTGFGAPTGYIFAAEKALRAETGLPLARTQNGMDETSHLDKFSELASGYRLVAENLVKVTQDWLFLTSSPVAEWGHPRIQAASSQMPAKTNPVILEWTQGLALSVQGEAQKVSLFAQNGRLQLNPFLPFVVDSLLKIEADLLTGLGALTEVFLPRVQIRSEVLEAHLVASPALLNALVPTLGYDRLSLLAPVIATRPPQTWFELEKLLTDHLKISVEEAHELVDPLRLIQGQLP